MRKYTSTYRGQHCNEISCARKTWKSQNWEELGTVSKKRISSPPHNAPRVKQSMPYSPTLWVGKLRPEGGSDSSEISCLLEVTQQEFGVLLSFPGAWTHTRTTSRGGCPPQAVLHLQVPKEFQGHSGPVDLTNCIFWRTQKAQHQALMGWRL